MKVEIKQALLEGHSPEVIVEAVHTNHPLYRKYKNSQFNLQNRRELAKRIIDTRADSKLFKKLGDTPYSNYLDNKARAISQDPHNSSPVEQSKEMLNTMTSEEKKHSNYSTKTKPFEEKPRLISSAKQ